MLDATQAARPGSDRRNGRNLRLWQMLWGADVLWQAAGIERPAGYRSTLAAGYSRRLDPSDDQLAALATLFGALEAMDCRRCSVAIKQRMRTDRGRPKQTLAEIARSMGISRQQLDRSIAQGLDELAELLEQRAPEVLVTLAPQWNLTEARNAA